MESKLIEGYEVREPTVGDVPELFELMTGGEGANLNTVVASMIKNCVFKDGKPVGDGIKQMPIKLVRAIVVELTAMSGLNDEKK